MMRGGCPKNLDVQLTTLVRTTLTMRNHTILVVLSLLVASSIAARDRISGLPHQEQSAASKTYGGFVNVNEKYGANLYYYFVESQNSPRDPLILVKRPRKIKINIFLLIILFTVAARWSWLLGNNNQHFII
jgi:hypothetical protein